MLGAFLLVLVAAMALRYATNILDKDAIFDERYIRLPIDDLLARGWSVETAIDMIRRNWKELQVLCTHRYPVGEAEKAVRVLGREITDGPEAVHIHIDAA